MPIKAYTQLAAALMVLNVAACKQKPESQQGAAPANSHTKSGQYKGLYSLGPNVKSFKDCATGKEYWVADSTKQLELQYWQLVTAENKDKPVYAELAGEIVPSNTEDADEAYANTLIVRKVFLITKDIPAGKCD